MLRADFGADAAVADAVAGGVEHRLPADSKPLRRAIGIDATEGEIQERLAGRDLCLKQFALRLIPAGGFVGAGLAQKVGDPDSQHLLDRTGNLGVAPGLVLLPIPAGGEFGQAAIVGFALAQLGGSLLVL